VGTFRDLDVWRDAMTLAEMCYRTTSSFPRVELFGLASQIRRASVSVASNLAEGHCRRTTGAYLNHISIALGSQGELSTLIEMSQRLQFLTVIQRRQLDEVNDRVGRRLYGLYRAVSARATGKE
jgi:four helix bundle protein